MKWSRGEHNRKVVTHSYRATTRATKDGTFFLEMQTEQSSITQDAQMKQMTWIS